MPFQNRLTRLCTCFVCFYIKDVYAMLMRIPHPLMLTDNRRNYGGSYTTHDKEQYLYQPVQPVHTQGAGMITFTVKDNQDPNTKHRNNLSLTNMQNRKLTSQTKEYDVVVWLLLVFSTVACIVIWTNISTQTAFKEIKLTRFALQNTGKYQLQSAGATQPLYCFLSAFFLLASSVIVGWQSKLHTFNWLASLICFFAVLACQGAALWLHISMYMDSGTHLFNNIALTATGTLVLHCLQATLTLLILAYYALAKETSSVNTSETIGNFWLCVVEDLNTIVCYVLVVRGCDAQSSVHDDQSTFFDIVCVVLIGFLQHIANVLMIMHGYLEVESDTKRSNITAPTAMKHYRSLVTLTQDQYKEVTWTPPKAPSTKNEDEFENFSQDLLNYDAWLSNKISEHETWWTSKKSTGEDKDETNIKANEDTLRILQEWRNNKSALEHILVLHVTEKLNQYVDQNSKYIDDNNRFKVDYDTNLDIITSIARSRAIIYFMIGIVIVFFYLRIAPTTEEYALGIPYETIRALAVIMMVSLGTIHTLWFEMRSQSSQGPLQSWDTSPAWKLITTASVALVFCSMLWHNTGITAKVA
jgi:hypothetical protein